ncbi:hypothetical protein V9T40_001752 [Parthenolecanium corni]|uniref:Uncharacterized protein n=1 Tax=Parthenolecanium corni TaxID=536013 RepID=A0AAN9TH53_9HEMI
MTVPGRLFSSSVAQQMRWIIRKFFRLQYFRHIILPLAPIRSLCGMVTSTRGNLNRWPFRLSPSWCHILGSHCSQIRLAVKYESLRRSTPASTKKRVTAAKTIKRMQRRRKGLDETTAKLSAPRIQRQLENNDIKAVEAYRNTPNSPLTVLPEPYVTSRTVVQVISPSTLSAHRTIILHPHSLHLSSSASDDLSSRRMARQTKPDRIACTSKRLSPPPHPLHSSSSCGRSKGSSIKRMEWIKERERE